jgi:hypothetical protein
VSEPEAPAPSPEELRRWGMLLYGPDHWQAELTAALGLRDSSRLREMLTGRRRIRPGLPERLRALAEAREGELQQLLAELREWLGDGR